MKIRVWIAASVALSSGAVAGQPPVFESKAGVEVLVPPGFVQVSKSSTSGTTATIADATEAAFQWVQGDSAVSMLILDLPLESSRQALAELPTESGPIPASLVRSFVGGVTSASATLRRGVESTPLMYDNTRKAYGIEITSTTPSGARTMLSQAQDSQEWRDVAKAGADPVVVRCLLSSIANAYDQGQPATATEQASRGCQVAQLMASNFIAEIGPGFFQPRVVIERFLQVFTTRGGTLIKFDTDTSGRELLESAWAKNWDGFRVPLTVAPHGLTSRLAFTNYNPSYLVGAALGAVAVALIWGFMFGIAMAKLRVKPIIAATLGHVALVAIALLVSQRELRDGSLTGLGLVRILAGLVAFPVTYFLVRRRYRGSEQLAARPPTSATGGP